MIRADCTTIKDTS